MGHSPILLYEHGEPTPVHNPLRANLTTCLHEYKASRLQPPSQAKTATSVSYGKTWNFDLL